VPAACAANWASSEKRFDQSERRQAKGEIHGQAGIQPEGSMVGSRRKMRHQQKIHGIPQDYGGESLHQIADRLSHSYSG